MTFLIFHLSTPLNLSQPDKVAQTARMKSGAKVLLHPFPPHQKLGFRQSTLSHLISCVFAVCVLRLISCMFAISCVLAI